MKPRSFRWITLTFVVVFAFVATVPAFAAWQNKVTGGGLAKAGSVSFTVNMTAWVDGDKSGGNLEYSREAQGKTPALSAHAKVACAGFFDGYAVAAGPAKFQEGSAGPWMVVVAKEGGVGSGDRVRVVFKSQTGARNLCENGNTSYPGTVVDGNFNIRAK